MVLWGGMNAADWVQDKPDLIPVQWGQLLWIGWALVVVMLEQRRTNTAYQGFSA
jgi:hypothetical protein